MNYKRDFWFYDDGVSSRYQSGTQLKNRYDDSRSVENINWSGMVNLAYEPFDFQEIGFTFLYNQNAIDYARVETDGFESTDPASTFRKFNLGWTQRNLNTYQIKGSHLLPEVDDIQFTWLVGLTQTTSQVWPIPKAVATN